MLPRYFPAIAILLPLLGCAPFASAPPLSPEQRALNDSQRQLVAETCDRVMGLHDGGLYRQECMDSLALSVAAQAQVAQQAGSNALCRGQGLHEGTAAFSTCMLDNQERRGSAGPVKLSYDSARPENAKSYFDVTNSVHWHREQHACAQIGLTPGTAAFGRCVAGLDEALSPNTF
jgi:hypothetical protein